MKKVLLLSSVKAYNPEKRRDACADDKWAAEQVIRANDHKVQGVILRVPTVPGRHDKNLLPMISMCKLKLLPLVTSELPAWHVIGVESNPADTDRPAYDSSVLLSTISTASSRADVWSDKPNATSS